MKQRKTAQNGPVRAIGYVRVSTSDQAENGTGLDAQMAAIVAECQKRGWDLVAIHEDAGFSGKSLKRPGISQALSDLNARKGDALVAAKLDRLSRSVKDFCGLMELSGLKGWRLVVLDLGIDTSTPAGEAMASVMATFAQFERRMIGLRTREGLAVRKAQGVKLGRPVAMAPETVQRILDDRSRGLTLTAIAEGLNADRVPTAKRGQRWYASTVKAVLDRLLENRTAEDLKTI